MGAETAVESLGEDGGSWNGEETFPWKKRWEEEARCGSKRWP